MAIRFPAEFAVEPGTSAGPGGPAQLSHGDILLGKVTRVSPDGIADITFPGFEARTHAGELLQAGNRVFAYVRKTRDETLLGLLPRVEEGDILSGAFVRGSRSETIGHFGEFEAKFRLPPAQAQTARDGMPVRAQVQVSGAKPALQLMPAGDPDSIIGGTVIAVREDGSVLIDLEGTTLIARSGESLSQGDQVYARVVQAGGKLILEIVQKVVAPEEGAGASSQPQAPTIEEVVARFLSAPEYARILEAMNKGDLSMGGMTRELLLLLQQGKSAAEESGWLLHLSRALAAILLDPKRHELVQQLANALKDSGLFLESRLLQAATSQKPDSSLPNDLKLALLLAHQRLSELSQPAGARGADGTQYPAELAGRVGQLLDALTAEQLHNLRTLPSQEFYIQLPFAHETGLDSIEIRISHHGGRARRQIDARNVLLTIAITTSNLGRVRAAVSIIDGQVNCRFRTEKQSVAELLDKNAPVLKRGLEALDYRVAYIGCSWCEDPRKLSVFENGAMVPEKGFDVRI